MNVKKIFSAFFILSFGFCFAESEGEKAFKENKPSEALVLLESEIADGSASAVAYNYLGLSYFQLGEHSKSVEAFEKGLNVPGTNKKILAFNQGNSYYAMRDYANAENSYSLALSADSTYYDALLNRANSYLMDNKFSQAIADYKRFIVVVPDNPQRDNIVQLIGLLETEIKNQEIAAQEAAKEAERLAEEEKRMKAELEKRAEEERVRLEAEEAERQRVEAERKAAEAERRRKLLEDVANSLQNTDSTNMSAGAEDLIDYEQEAELD